MGLNTKMGKCALCGQNKELQLSHIIPKFAINYLKKTSIGRVRNQEAKVVQDGEKRYMLCHDCEELFSSSERSFANKIFYPHLQDHDTEFEYDTSIYYFMTSLAWRSLYQDINSSIEERIGDRTVFECMINAENVMHDFLLGKRGDLGDIEHHILFFDEVKSTNVPNDSVNLLVHRQEQSYSNVSGETVYTISNLMGILLVTLYKKAEGEKWDNTQIFNKTGKIYAKDQGVVSDVIYEIGHWHDQAEEAKRKLSQRERGKIIQGLDDAGDDIKKNPIYQDIINDLNLRK